jgi:hypothetical protein
VGYYTAGVNPIDNAGRLINYSSGATRLVGDTDYDGDFNYITPIATDVNTATVSVTGRFGLYMDDHHPDYTSPAYTGAHTISGTGAINGLYVSEIRFDTDTLVTDRELHFAVFRDYASGVVVPNSYLVAVEDIHSGSDNDYNDMVFRMIGVRPVPEPGSAVLLVLALLPTLLRRRHQAA